MPTLRGALLMSRAQVMMMDSQPQCATPVSLVNEYGTGSGSGSDDVLRCVPVVDVYAQASIHIFLQVVSTYFTSFIYGKNSQKNYNTQRKHPLILPSPPTT
jgi:hypothetical protein